MIDSIMSSSAMTIAVIVAMYFITVGVAYAILDAFFNFFDTMPLAFFWPITTPILVGAGITKVIITKLKGSKQ